jgi:hypothetical protein
MNLSVVSVGRGCLLMACEWLNCCEIMSKQVFECQEDKDTLFEVCFTCVNFFKILNRFILDIIDLHSSIINYHRYLCKTFNKRMQMNSHQSVDVVFRNLFINF